MPNPKTEWIRTVLGVELEESVSGSSIPESPLGGGLPPSLQGFHPGSVPPFDDGRVYADAPLPRSPGPAADDEVLKKIVSDFNKLKPNIEKAKDIFTPTPALEKLFETYAAAEAAFGQKMRAKDFAGAASALASLDAALKALLDAAAAQDKVAAPKADAAEKTVKDLVSKNKLAEKTNAEKLELLHQLQGRATQKPEFRAAQGEIYKTLGLDKQFLAEDEKKRDVVVKQLVGTDKDKADLKDKRDRWTKLSPDEKVATLRKALEAQCKAWGILVPGIEPFDRPRDKGKGILNGKFNSKDGKIHVNLNSDPDNKMNNFDTALDLIFHENSHHYQDELVKNLENKTLTKKDPRYEEALLFQINSGVGYVNDWEGKEVYEKQPTEAHAKLNGPKTAEMVVNALK